MPHHPTITEPAFGRRLSAAIAAFDLDCKINTLQFAWLYYVVLFTTRTYHDMHFRVAAVHVYNLTVPTAV